MKNFFLSFLSIFITTSTLFGQIEVTNAVLPQVGGEVEFSVEDNIKILNESFSGESTFDFTDVQSSISITAFQDTIEGNYGSYFPGANKVTINALNASEFYYKVTSSELKLMGKVFSIGIGLPALILKPNVPLTLMKVPLNYGGSLSGSHSFSITFPSSILPDSIIDMVPLKFDSIRYWEDVDYSLKVDAYGTLKLGSDSYEVLKTSIIEVVDPKIEVKVQFFGWQDVSGILIGIAPEVAPFLEKRTNKKAEYYHNERRGAQLSYQELENDTIHSIMYQKSATDTKEWEFTAQHIDVYPNPATSDVIHITTTEELGATQLKIYNMKGQEAYVGKFNPNVEKNTIPIAHLIPGNYILQLFDRGKLLGSQSFIKQ